MAEIRELLVRELRAACLAAISGGADPRSVAADLAARAGRMRAEEVAIRAALTGRARHGGARNPGRRAPTVYGRRGLHDRTARPPRGSALPEAQEG